MADDTVELLRQLGPRQADFFGYSMGAGTALNIGIRYPDRVRKLVLTSVVFDVSGLPPNYLDTIDQRRPEHLRGTVWHEEYPRIAPRHGGPAKAELAILPATNHIAVENNAKLLLPIIPAFLGRPMPS